MDVVARDRHLCVSWCDKHVTLRRCCRCTSFLWAEWRKTQIDFVFHINALVHLSSSTALYQTGPIAFLLKLFLMSTFQTRKKKNVMFHNKKTTRRAGFKFRKFKLFAETFGALQLSLMRHLCCIRHCCEACDAVAL